MWKVRLRLKMSASSWAGSSEVPGYKKCSFIKRKYAIVPWRVKFLPVQSQRAREMWKFQLLSFYLWVELFQTLSRFFFFSFFLFTPFKLAAGKNFVCHFIARILILIASWIFSWFMQLFHSLIRGRKKTNNNELDLIFALIMDFNGSCSVSREPWKPTDFHWAFLFEAFF